MLTLVKPALTDQQLRSLAASGLRGCAAARAELTRRTTARLAQELNSEATPREKAE